MTKFRFFISPYFANNYYLLRDIKEIIKKYKFSGSLLDFGCGEKPYKGLFTKTSSYKGIDFRNYSKNPCYKGEKPDLYFNNDYFERLTLPFPNNSFDNVVSFQVLQHHKNPQKMIDEMFRIVKNNGLILLSFTLLVGLHEVPNDYFRFTEFGLFELLKKYKHEVLEIKRQGSIFSTISYLLNDYLANLANKDKTNYFLSGLIYPPFLLFSYFSLLLDKIFPSDKIFLNYLVLIRATDKN